MNLVAGLIFGVVVGGIMRAPGAEFVVAANAVNLSVMAALWLGISLAPGQKRQQMLLETVAAALTFVMAALVFQHSPFWLYAGFAFQAFWSLLHIGGRFGIPAQEWAPGFLAMVNLGFIAAYYLIVSVA
ncbi:MAG: hypothetical protein QNJ29_01245 [Rhizobiaceae bacterium]|nr:hypothetical protein [Rhizobiaceae bacterium]